MKDILIAVFYILLFLVIIPLATIWALNTLFPALSIPVGFDTWLAVSILISLFQSAFKKGV